MLLESSRIGGRAEILCSEVRLLCDEDVRVRTVVGEESCGGDSGRFACGKRERCGEIGEIGEVGEIGEIGEDTGRGDFR